MKLASKIILFVFGIGLFFSSCEKKKCEDTVPEISYMDFKLSETDSNAYLLIFEFADCDGDIGMETTSSILDENGEVQLFNFFIDLYFLDQGVWYKHEINKDAGLHSKIPILENSNLDPSLEGEIEKSILSGNFVIWGYDTIKFKSKILDNSGHYSNEVETPAFVSGI